MVYVAYQYAQQGNIPVLQTTRSVMQLQSFHHILHFNAVATATVIIRIAELWVRILGAGHLGFGVEGGWEASAGKVETHGLLVFVTVLYDVLTGVMIAQFTVALSWEATA